MIILVELEFVHSWYSNRLILLTHFNCHWLVFIILNSFAALVSYFMELIHVGHCLYRCHSSLSNVVLTLEGHFLGLLFDLLLLMHQLEILPCFDNIQILEFQRSDLVECQIKCVFLVFVFF